MNKSQITHTEKVIVKFRHRFDDPIRRKPFIVDPSIRTELEKFITLVVSSLEKRIRQEALEWLLNHTSGGGDWRRVAIKEIAALAKEEKDT